MWRGEAANLRGQETDSGGDSDGDRRRKGDAAPPGQVRETSQQEHAR